MSLLIENLLNIKATDHRKIQEEIRRNLRNLGYEVELEKKIWAKVEKEKKPIAGQFFLPRIKLVLVRGSATKLKGIFAEKINWQFCF